MIDNFNDLDHYLKAYKTNPNKFAAVPVPLVAAYYGITDAAVVSRLKNNKLKGIMIGKTRLVAVSSLGRGSPEEFVRAKLEDLASSGGRCVFYKEIMDLIGLSTKVDADRGRIGSILGDISLATYRDNKILLSVLVHGKNSRPTKPSPSFFDLAESLGLVWEDELVFVEEQTQKVLKYYSKA